MEAKEHTSKYTVQIFENEKDIPERFRNKIKKGEMLAKFTSLTSDFLPLKWLNELSSDDYNHRILYRHRDPESEKWQGRVFGRILESTVRKFEEKGVEKHALDTWYRIFGDMKIERDMQEYIKKCHERGEQIGVSKSYILTKDKKNGDIVRVFHLEDSITHIPECPACLPQEIIQMEKDNMTDPNEIDKDAEEINKLREELESTRLELEAKESAIEEKDLAFKQLEEKVQEFEKLVGEKENEKVSMEDKIIALNDRIGKLNESMTYMEKKPILEEIKRLEKKQKIFDECIFEFEKKWEMDKLISRKEDLEKRDQEPQIVTKTLKEEREEMERKAEEISLPLEVAFSNSPELLKQMKELGFVK